MGLKNFIYNLTPPYLRHIHRAHKVYNTIAPELRETQHLFARTLERNREKIKRGEKIRVAFLHMYATEIQDLSIFDMMLQSPFFDPFFIVIPVLFSDQQHLAFNYRRTLTELTEKYGEERVLSGYDIESHTCTDYTDQFDMASTNTPYDGLTRDFYRSRYWASKGIPVFYIPYFYMGLCRVTKENLQMPDFNFFWKVFLPNKYSKSLAREYMANMGRNAIVTGYPKFDHISEISSTPHRRKQIIIAPHHLIGNSSLDRGGFREYAGFLQSIPSKYPQIDFIFRPHPQLFATLKHYWPKDKIDNWLNRFLSNNNVIYSTEGDYIKLLANSDALIHDCGSFVAEYLFFNKPCAYIYREGIDYQAMQLQLGLRCLEEYYPIEEDDDWYHFIEDVILDGQDIQKEKREHFARENIMINYPYATQAVYDSILQEMMG